MRDALARLNDRFQREHGLSLAMRIGVNTGEVVAQTAPTPGEGMVSGDATNVAARLEQLAEPGQILVSARTARGARGFEFRPRGALALRGKADPVRAFELIGEGAITREAGIPEAPFVGRPQEIALLESVFERVLSDRRPHLVTIYGDAGVGKSRLVREVEQRLVGVEPETTTIVGRCLPYGQGVTYWPLSEILKRSAGVLDSDPPATAVDRIERLVRDAGPADLFEDLTRAAAALAFTVGLAHPSVAFAEMEPRQVAAE